jgi:hypothetical protein
MFLHEKEFDLKKINYFFKKYFFVFQIQIFFINKRILFLLIRVLCKNSKAFTEELLIITPNVLRHQLISTAEIYK